MNLIRNVYIYFTKILELVFHFLILIYYKIIMKFINNYMHINKIILLYLFLVLIQYFFKSKIILNYDSLNE
jgi:hypothetical protein